jgi:tRNA (guanine10-N2)-methyltransferase
MRMEHQLICKWLRANCLSIAKRGRAPGYIPPKKPYSFDAMLNDILHFGAEFLVDNGKLCMWMPTANDEDLELAIPQSPYLELISSCVQEFNKCTAPIATSTTGN